MVSKKAKNENEVSDLAGSLLGGALLIPPPRLLIQITAVTEITTKCSSERLLWMKHFHDEPGVRLLVPSC